MQSAKIEPEVGGAYLAADLMNETRRTNDLYESLSTTKMNINNNNNDDETAIKEELKELTPLPSNLQTNIELTVTSSPVDFRKQVDYAVDCSPTNVTSSSSPSDEMVVTPSKHALNDVINDDYDEYACDTPVSLSPSRDSLASVTSSDKQTGSTSALMTSTTPRSGHGGITSPAHLSGGSAMTSARCPPVREAVDPAKYITLSGEADGVKYACSKCGNVYKWRKSLNKHWKEKHDGEAPDGQSPTSASVRLAVASSQHHRVPAPLGASQRHLMSPLDKHSATGNGRSMYASGASSLKTSPAIAADPSLTSSSSIASLAATASGSFRQPTKGSLAALNPALFGKFSLHPKSGSRISSHQHHSQHQNLLQSSPGDSSSSSAWTSNRQMHVDPLLRASATQNGSNSSPKPMDYFRLAYDAAAAAVSTRDVLSTMSSRIEAPVDLSESSRPYRQSNTVAESSDDMDVLDLSRKFSENGRNSQKSSSSAVDEYLAVQDEPLDFSFKVTSTPARTSPINFTTAAIPHPGSTSFSGHLHHHQQVSLSQNKFPFTPPIMTSSVEFGNRKSDVGLVRCTQCPLQFSSPTKLNRHYSREHADAISGSGDDRRHLPCTERSSGSAQLYRYLTANAPVPHPVVAHRSDDSTSCVVCGLWCGSRSAAARHFDDHHAGGLANPYRHRTAMTGNRSESDETPLRRNPVNRAPSHLVQSPPVSATGGCGTLPSTDDLLMAHCADEQTAIVIPQAPEDTMSSGSLAGLSKMFIPNALPPKVGSSTTGRARRAELLGFSVSSSGTASSGTMSGPTPSAEVLLPFKCQLCEYRARWPSEMTQHAKNHSDEKPFRCPQCSYRSKWKWDVVKHLKRCGGGNCTARDVIDMSASMGSTSSGLIVTNSSEDSPLQQQHQQQKSGTFSTQRRRRFQTVRSVLINVQPQNTPVTSEKLNGAVDDIVRPPSGRNEVQEVLVNGSGVMVKTERGYDLSEVNNGSDLVQRASPPPLSTAQPEATTKPEVKRETAALVSDETSSPTATDRDVTMSGDQGLHYCVQCPFVGHSPAELRRHQRVHSDEKPYSCRSCSYSSKWKCDLKKHLRAYNHVSAVPLVYGGHGRKPTLPADWGLGLVDARDLVGLVRDSDFYDQAAVSTNANGDDGVTYEHGQSKGKHGGSGLAAGITTGGRLRCRRCDFEAVDITSFLQHKALHHSNRYEESAPHRPLHPVAGPGTTQDSVLHGNGGSRKRKSSKQNRVPQLSVNSGAEHINADVSDEVLETRPVDEEKFWKSLGLKSSEGSFLMKSLPEVHTHREPTLSTATQAWNMGKSLLSDVSASYVSSPAESRQDDGMDCDNVSTLSESTSGLDEADYPPEVMVATNETDSLPTTTDEPVDLCSRPNARKDEDEDQLSASLSHQCVTDESRSNFTAGGVALNGATSHVRRHWSWSKGIEGCTWRTSLNGSDMSTSSTGGGSPAEAAVAAEELAAMSRRKRKLRTCDKCGYVTDNLTTLQRHSAKHGSTGRHRCSLCTYTVERQHILDYHIKIVHSAPQTPSAISPLDQATSTRQPSSENSFNDQSQTDDFEPDPDITFLTKRRLTNGDQLSTEPTQGQTSRVEKDGDSRPVATMPLLRAGLCVGRSCIRCGFISRTDGAAARHRLVGHSGFHFRCDQEGCERRASSVRVLKTHQVRVHSRQDQVEPGKSHEDNTHLSCTECPYRSASPSRVTSHARFHVQPFRKHRCPDCSYSVDRRIQLGQHRRLHDRKQSSSTMTSARLRCGDCPFRCRSAAQLALHRRHHLTGSGKTAARRQFECTRCSFGVDVSNAFQHHRKLHMGEAR